MKKLLFLLCICILLPAAPTTAQGEPTTWTDRVFYEIFVRSFYDSDGDGIGDLQGVIAKLDYLNDGDPTTTDDLGVTGIWLMPVMASPSYHGYDVTDYRAINPDYGTNDDFLQLIDEAHERGIAVIIDLTVNHTSVEHPWFVASAAGDPEYADYYRWVDEASETFRGSSGQTVWHLRNGRYYFGLFDVKMPDLNYENPTVMAEMTDIARFWLEDMGVDGFRLDGLKHVVEEGRQTENTAATQAWAAAFHDAVEAIKPGTLLVGEVWSSSTFASAYVPEGADLVFEFDLALALIRGAKFGSAALVNRTLDTVLSLYPPNSYATFLTNHDQNRLMVEMEGDRDAAKSAADLLLTLPGVPFIYYGEEIGMIGSKPDERIRTPMQWSSETETGGFTSGTPWQVLQSDYADVNVAAQEGDADSLLNHYRALIHLRTAHPALAQGDFTLIESESRAVMSFLRQHEDEMILVILNLSGRVADDYALTLDPALDGMTATPLLGANELAEPTVSTAYQPTAELPPHSALVLQIGE